MTDEHYITLLGNKIDYADERINIFDLRFYAKNPRVLSKLTRTGELGNTNEDKKQKIIQENMKKENSVENLLRTIKHQGGISEPLIVQINTKEVLEGNSRLAALRLLYDKEQEEKYLTAPCRVVRLEEDEIDALLYQQHIDGKTQWSAYDKAYSAYHRVKIDGVGISEYAERTSLSKNEIHKQIEIIELMNTEGVLEEATKNTERFSYYDAICRSTNLKRCFDENFSLKLERHVLDEIKQLEPSFTALELRDKLPLIARKPKILKKWMHRTIEFQEAVNSSTISEPKKYLENAIRNLQNIEKKDVKKLDNNERNVLGLEVKKCKREIDRIKELIDKQE